MNDKGQVVFFTLMFTVVLIILAIALVAPVNEFVTDARGDSYNETTGLGCDNATILANETTGEFTRGTCVITDLYTPYFFGFLIALGAAVLGARVLAG